MNSSSIQKVVSSAEVVLACCIAVVMFFATMQEAFSQTMSKHCENMSCVAWGGASQCSSDAECRTSSASALPPCNCDANNDGITDAILPTNCDPSACTATGTGKQRACCGVMKFCNGIVMTAQDNYCGAPDVPCCPYVCLSKDPNKVFECCGAGEGGSANQCFPMQCGNSDCAYNSVVGAPLKDGEECVEGDPQGGPGCGNPGTCQAGVCIPKPSPPPGSNNTSGGSSLPPGGFGGANPGSDLRSPGDGATPECPPPTITTQPRSQSVVSGATVRLETVVRSQTNISSPQGNWFRCPTTSLQWEFKANGATSFVPVALADGPVLDLEAVTALDGGTYRLKVNDDIYSSLALLTVTAAPNVGSPIIREPLGALCPLATSTQFVVGVAPGRSVTYQWEFKASTASTFTAVAGAITNTLSITNCSAALFGRYRVKVREGTKDYYSREVSLAAPSGNLLRITTEPIANAALRLNQAFTLNVAATGGTGTLRYQWQRSLPSLTMFSDIVGAKGSSYTINAFSPTQAGLYRVIVRDSSGFGQVLSKEVALGMSSVDTNNVLPPQFLSPVVSRSGPSGAVVTIAPRVSGTAPITYKWFFKGVELSGTANLPTLARTINTTTTGAYTLRVSNSFGSVEANFQIALQTSSDFVLKLNDQPVSKDPAKPTLIDLGSVSVNGEATRYAVLTLFNGTANILGYDIELPAGVGVVPALSELTVYGVSTYPAVAPAGERNTLYLGLDRRSARVVNASFQIKVNNVAIYYLRVIGNVIAQVSPSPAPIP